MKGSCGTVVKGYRPETVCIYIYIHMLVCTYITHLYKLLIGDPSSMFNGGLLGCFEGSGPPFQVLLESR